MPSTRVVQVVEVATHRPTRGLTLCDEAEVRPPTGDVDYATTRHLPGRRLRAHHGGGGRSVVGRVRVELITPYVRRVDQRPRRHDRDVHLDVEALAGRWDERADGAAHRARRVVATRGRDKAHPSRQDVG